MFEYAITNVKLSQTYRTMSIIYCHMQGVHLMTHPKKVELELLIRLQSFATYLAVMMGVFGFGGDALRRWGISKNGTLAVENVTCLSQEMSGISQSIGCPFGKWFSPKFLNNTTQIRKKFKVSSEA